MRPTTRQSASVEYKRPKKPLINAEERKRQAKSLITYRPDGGDAS